MTRSFARFRFLLGMVHLFLLILSLSSTGVAQPFFEDVTQEALVPSGAQLAVVFNTAAIGDYDNDGWPDLFMTEAFGPQIALLRNQGNGRYADGLEAIEAKISTQNKGAGVLFGDYDNDGDLDLYMPVGRFTREADRDALLRNDRGLFRDLTLEAGLTQGLPSDSAIWLDYDRDGFLDLYVGNMLHDSPNTNTFYRNQGDGTFANITEAIGLLRQFHPSYGGSNGGFAAGDFNNDAWPDLYVGVFEAPNRLYFNDQGRGFVEVTTGEIADEGQALGVAVGDINNDGTLDVFQAGGGDRGQFRSKMLLNLREGQFIDVLEAVGLGILTVNSWAPSMADFDNDGDLDLLVPQAADPPLAPFYFLNNGDGTFVDATDAANFPSEFRFSGVIDYNRDGFLDVLLFSFSESNPFPGLYRNRGNANHWLQIELVGLQSNRNGIGARLLAKAGDLEQMREILGGLGWIQEEYLAHFGLADHTQVEQLEIRWPSGQVDLHSNIPADRRIRLFEGRSGFHVVQPSILESALPDTVVDGTSLNIKALVRPALFEADAQITTVTADLGGLGGEPAIPLLDRGDGTYTLETAFKVTSPNSLRSFSVMIEQATTLGPRWVQLSQNLAILPSEDLVLFDEGLKKDWQVEGIGGLEVMDLTQRAIVYRANMAGSFQVKPEGIRGWRVAFLPADPIATLGFKAVHFAFHSGDVRNQNFNLLNLLINDQFIDLVRGDFRVDIDLPAWQLVEIPLEAFGEPIVSIVFEGNLEGTFYLDDLRLVTTKAQETTAVVEAPNKVQPEAFFLTQNYPNPFNSSTTIRFTLPQKQKISLAVYNLAGQRVASLFNEVRQAGSYTVNWNGRDNNGLELSSGVYLYRLETRAQLETRKLLLLK